MSITRLIFRSLLHHWRINAAVALGVAAATAVLVGALLVGDSVRGSLRELTLDRLGRIDQLLVVDRFFRSELVEQLNTNPAFQANHGEAAPAILFPHVTIERRSDDRTARAGSVLVLGSDERFWKNDTVGNVPKNLPGANEIVLNESLAAELGAKVGDQVTLRLPRSNQVPADSPLANKNDRVRGLPGLKVVEVIPASGLGQFNVQPSQTLPHNAFVSLETLQKALDETDRINAIFVSGKEGSRATPISENLAQFISPNLDDFGVRIKRVTRTFRPAEGAERTAIDYTTITTDRMIFSPEMAAAIQKPPVKTQPLLTYLANSINRVVEGKPQSPGIPYSMVTAVKFDSSETWMLSLNDVDGNPIPPLAETEIVLNSWAADNLQAQVGDTIRIAYFEPETADGDAVERTVEFKLKAITPLTKPAKPPRRNRPAEFDQAPTPATDPDLTPEVEGVTDQETIDDWDAPFPFDYKRVRQVDEDYWEEYRTTPKAFVSLSAGQRLWGSRFGNVTSFRTGTGNTGWLRDRLAQSSSKLGFQFTPIKQRQLAASRGTTPFDGLFLALSFFVIAAALMLVALLFRLGIEQRSAEVGTLLAMGLRRRAVAGALIWEGIMVAAAGAAVGIVVGLGYAWLLLAGLRTWWLGAITSPFLHFHVTPTSLIVGYVLGVAISVATIAWTVRQTKNFSVRRLLSNQLSELRPVGAMTGPAWASGVCLAVALVLCAMATRLGGMAQAGAFVAGGAALLIGLLIAIRRRLRRGSAATVESWSTGGELWRLATRNAARNPGRSVITIGLMATATFLIVALSSFRLAPTEAGVGGFDIVAETSAPVYEDLSQLETRNAFFGSQASELSDATILGLRLRAGDNASCNNLYQATQPRVIGVTSRFINHFDHQSDVHFTWADSDARDASQRANPWQLLRGPAQRNNTPVPVVIDKNTAMYSLHLYWGIGEEFEVTYDDRPVRFRVVGLLENSVLQGNLLVGEADFRQLFPSLSGYRYFLVDAPQEKLEAVTTLLEDRLSDQGFDAANSRDVLAQLLAVQNTYLSTFQSLGALGLLLGTLGLATVQLRNVLERRGELALLRATGYRHQRLAKLVLLENIALLVAGLLTGVLAALLAVLPLKLLGEGAISWSLLRDLGLMLLAVLVAGFASSFISVRAVLRMPLLASLRGE